LFSFPLESFFHTFFKIFKIYYDYRFFNIKNYIIITEYQKIGGKKYMKKFWYMCKKKTTNERLKIGVLAKDQAEAEQILNSNDEYIPIQYVGWN
jgi:hypothetical protein